MIDASRRWHKTFKRTLEKLGCKALNSDKSIYIFFFDGEFAGFIIIHVDDFFSGGNSAYKTMIIAELIMIFQIGCREQDEFKYLGWKPRSV